MADDSILGSPKKILKMATTDGGKVRSLTAIAKQGIGGWLLAIATAGIAGLDSMLQLLLITPATMLQKLIRNSVTAFFLKPFGIIGAGAAASARGASEFGIFGLLVAVAIVLASIYMVIQYLQEAETTDVPVPGLVMDVIPWAGAEEEADPGD